MYTRLRAPRSALCSAAVSVSRELEDRFLYEMLRAAYDYVPGIAQGDPSEVDPSDTSLSRRVRRARDTLRDGIERLASGAGFARRHFGVRGAAENLAQVIDRLDGLEATYASLADEHSRRMLVELLKLRVLGPYHVTPRMTAQEFRQKQAQVDRAWRIEAPPVEVSDPFFRALHLYEVPCADGGAPIRLYTHSAALVNIFVLQQYRYAHDRQAIEPRRDAVVLDAGGCWGDTALYFANLAGPGGRVYAFEFDSESLAIMRQNLELNPRLADRVQVVEKALWHGSGETLRFAPAGQLTSLTGGHAAEGESTAVKTVTIDDFVAGEGIGRVDFVKADVEGAELNVLRGADRCLREHTPELAVAAYHHDGDLVELPECVRGAGSDYRLFLDHFSASRDETVLFGRPARPAS